MITYTMCESRRFAVRHLVLNKSGAASQRNGWAKDPFSASESPHMPKNSPDTPHDTNQPCRPSSQTPAGDWVLACEPGDIDGVHFRQLQRFHDPRGWLAELYRHDETPPELQPAMAYISQSEPGAARGPHEHVEQTDHFVFLGPGDFVVYLWDPRSHSPSCGKMARRVCGGSDLCALTIPPGVVHAYRNVSDQPSQVFNAPNRLYAGTDKKEPVDEIRHEDVEDSPYLV